MIHTGGEQIQGNETRNFRDRGPRIGEKEGGGGGQAGQHKLSSLNWTRTHDEPGKSGTYSYIAAGLLRDDVSFGHCAPAQFWTVGAKASHGNGHLLDACFMYSRIARKRKFSTLSLRSAVENGSFAWLILGGEVVCAADRAVMVWCLRHLREQSPFLLAQKSAKNHWISWHCPFKVPFLAKWGILKKCLLLIIRTWNFPQTVVLTSSLEICSQKSRDTTTATVTVLHVWNFEKSAQAAPYRSPTQMIWHFLCSL